MTIRMTTVTLFTLLGFPLSANAETGRDIAQKVDAADSGWGDEQVSATMFIKSASGREVKRTIRTRSLDGGSKGDRSLVVFDHPRDVKGTAFLTHTHKTGNDAQWLYLPALKRVKRISSSNRSGPFMGSEFAYEDISSEEIERYSYKYIKEEPCAVDQVCHVYERYPVDKNSGYSKQVVYADKSHLRIHKIEFFDRKKSHQKTLSRTGYQPFGRYWRASRWEMKNHLNKKSTRILWSKRKFGVGLNSGDFDKNAIKRFK